VPSVVQKRDCIHLLAHRAIKAVEEGHQGQSVWSEFLICHQMTADVGFFSFLGCYRYNERIPNGSSLAVRI